LQLSDLNSRLLPLLSNQRDLLDFQLVQVKLNFIFVIFYYFRWSIILLFLYLLILVLHFYIVIMETLVYVANLFLFRDRLKELRTDVNTIRANPRLLSNLQILSLLLIFGPHNIQLILFVAPVVYEEFVL